MRALTICEPFASAIVFGGKNVENRPRRIPARGPVLIHAGRNLDWYDRADWVHERWPECPDSRVLAMHQFQARHGKVIGVAYFGVGYKFDPATENRRPGRWETGPWCIPIHGVIAVDPFPARGHQGPFVIPTADLPQQVIDAAEQLTEQWAEVAA